MVFLHCMEEYIRVFLPITEPTGKVRLKKLISDSFYLGEPAGSIVGSQSYVNLANGNYYLEWQIGYDLGVSSLISLIAELEALIEREKRKLEEKKQKESKESGKGKREESVKELNEKVKREIKRELGEIKGSDSFRFLKDLRNCLRKIKEVKRSKTKENHYKDFKKTLNSLGKNRDFQRLKESLGLFVEDIPDKYGVILEKADEVIEKIKILEKDLQTFLKLEKLLNRLKESLSSSELKRLISENQQNFVIPDLFCGDDEHLFYKNSKGEIRVLYELPVMLYFGLKKGMYDLSVLDEIEKFAQLIEKKNCFLENSEQILREKVLDKLDDGIDFGKFIEKTPGYIYVKKEDNLEYFIELKLGHKQRAVGYQAMVYLCIPLKQCSFFPQESIDKLKENIDSKSYCCFEILDSNKKIVIDTLKAFILASRIHKEEVLCFLKVIKNKLETS